MVWMRGGVDSGSLQVGAQQVSVGIVAELADHLDGIAEAGDSDGLIGSFAAGVSLEAGSGDGFAGEGNVFDGGDEVGVDAADDR